MQLGPNMKHLLEIEAATSVKACVIAGPGDLVVWEASACVDSDGVPVELIGRGYDLDGAAASVLALLSADRSPLAARTPDGTSTIQVDAGGAP